MAWYAKFDGVDGSAQHKDHKAWSNVSRFNMGGHKAGGGGTGVGRVGGKMHLDDISMGIMTDKALPKLLEAAVKGKVFKKVEIHGTATYGERRRADLSCGRARKRADHELPARRSRQRRGDR